MIHDGRVVGAPLVDYLDTKANIEALGSLEAGMTAYASDAEEVGFYDGSDWQWGMAAALVWIADANDNFISTVSNVELALEYLAENPASFVLDDPTASVGLTAVDGVAATAMRSDAAPALDQGIVPTWTGVHTFQDDIAVDGDIAVTGTVDGLDLSELGDTLFDAASGLLLLGPHCPISSLKWITLRQQEIEISGAFHQEAGRWPGTRGLVIEKATINIIKNPSFETSVSDSWSAYTHAGFVVSTTRDATTSTIGNSSKKVDITTAPDATDWHVQRYHTTTIAVLIGDEFALSFWGKAESTHNIRTNITNGAGVAISNALSFTLTTEWQLFSGVFTINANDNTGRAPAFYLNDGVTEAIWLDRIQLEEKAYTTSYCDGSLGTGYSWGGAVHNTISTRTATTVNLDAHVGLINENDTLSFSLWVQMGWDYDDGPTINWTIWDGFGAGGRLQLRYNPTNDRFEFYGSDGVDSFTVQSAVQTFVAGDLIHLVATADFNAAGAGSYQLYVNITQTSQITSNVTAPTLTDWTVGSEYDGTNQCGCVVSECATLTDILTADEIAGLYALQRPLVDAGALHSPSADFLSLIVGNYGNYTELEADGTLHMIGDATVFNDLQFAISNAKVPASNAPSWETFTTNTNEYGFAVDDYIDTQANETPHSWKLGTAGHVHVHATTKAANATGSDRFAKFTVVVAYNDTGETWQESSFTAELTIPNGTSALEQFYLDMGDLTLTSYVEEAEIKCRVTRIAATGGTEYSGNIFITQIGIHLEEDTVGSRTEVSK